MITESYDCRVGNHSSCKGIRHHNLKRKPCECDCHQGADK